MLRLLLRPPASGAGRIGARGDGERLEILHLGFEDPAMPGSGGGSVRTHEIGRRIAASHDLTVLVQRFPGCAERVQDGVRYVHVGVGSGRTRLTRVLGYMLMLPLEVRRRPADVVVEDFFAPVSSMAAPLWTGRPTVAMVQWLNAREKAAQYKVPVHLVERFGIRRHSRAVAVSEGIAERLRAVNPRLTVDVVGNGVPAEAFDAARSPGDDVVFVGRLEIAQKGLDLLLAAWARACERVPGTLVIAGTGPDEQALRALAEELGVADRVRFVGWVAGAAKFALLGSARVVAVPSRFETFGIVALEAAATGAPVVAFDIDCLREVVPDACGRRVPPFDVDAYADALVATHVDTGLRVRHRCAAGVRPGIRLGCRGRGAGAGLPRRRTRLRRSAMTSVRDGRPAPPVPVPRVPLPRVPDRRLPAPHPRAVPAAPTPRFRWVPPPEPPTAPVVVLAGPASRPAPPRLRETPPERPPSSTTPRPAGAIAATERAPTGATRSGTSRRSGCSPAWWSSSPSPPGPPA